MDVSAGENAVMTNRENFSWFALTAFCYFGIMYIGVLFCAEIL